MECLSKMMNIIEKKPKR